MAKEKVLISLIAALLIVNCFASVKGAPTEPSNNLFKFVCDQALNAPFGGYWIVSDTVFPLKIYALSLADVGNYRVSNRSALLQGIRDAVAVTTHPPWDPETDGIEEVYLSLWFDLAMKLNVSVSLCLVEDWESYRTLVESSENAILVNAHDEYLPVPEGYSREQWVDKVADFMLNRWGTWAHVCGCPFGRVWYQNGTTEEWGEDGFKRLMSHIGIVDPLAHPTLDPLQPVHTQLGGFGEELGISWRSGSLSHHVGSYGYSEIACPLDGSKFYANNLCIGDIYRLWPLLSAAVVRFSQDNSTSAFGIYVHVTPQTFYSVNGDGLVSDLLPGFLATAGALFAELDYPAACLYTRDGSSAWDKIAMAEREGRTVGLAEAKLKFQEALEHFAAAEYKMAAADAISAVDLASKARTSNIALQVIGVATVLAVAVGAGTYFKISKKKQRAESECVEPKQSS